MGIPELLQQLATTLDPRDKSKIRAQLRKLGHRGGAKSTGAPSPQVRRVSTPAIQQPPLPHFDDSYYVNTPLSQIPDEKLMWAMRHKGLPMNSELWGKLRMEWNNRLAQSGRLYSGLGKKENKDCSFAAKREHVAHVRKHVGRRANR